MSIEHDCLIISHIIIRTCTDTDKNSSIFQNLNSTLQLDAFLMAVLHYFAAFIEKIEEDRKPTIMEKYDILACNV